MAELFRDTAFGKLVRLVTKNKSFQYPEEKDPSLWTRLIDERKSGNLAHHGDTSPPEEGDEPEGLGGVRTREEKDRTDSADSSKTRVPSQDGVNQVSGVKVDPEKGKDVHLVSWYGPDDSENPLNWSATKKFFVTAQICLFTTSVYIGSAIFTPGLENLSGIFGVSIRAARLGLCLFVLSYGIGPMLWSPMSEIPQIGRNPVYLGTLVIFVALQAPTALSTNFGMFLAFRFISGFFGSPVLATGGASIADMYPPRKRAYALTIWGLFNVCGPTLGPLVGGFAVQYAPVGFGGFTAPWTWPIWELMWLNAACLVLLFFCLPETSANNILTRRTMRLRKITGDDNLSCESELMSANMTVKDMAMISLFRPLILTFTEPMVFLLNLYLALIYGLLYIWFNSFVIVFGEIYGFGLGIQGLTYLGLLIGAMVAVPPYFWYLRRYQEPKFDSNGNIEPEQRLIPAFVGVFCVPICLFWFGWSARPDVHWIMPIIGSAWFSAGAVLLFNAVLNYLPDAYPDYAASTLASNEFIRSLFGKYKTPFYPYHLLFLANTPFRSRVPSFCY